MNSKKAKFAIAAVVAAAATGGVVIAGANRMHSESVVDDLTRPSTEAAHGMEAAAQSRRGGHAKEPSPYIGEQGRIAWIQRNWRFAGLWMARRERDVSDEIIPFLKDRDPSLRERAVRALGRLEDPKSEAPLQAIWQRQQEARQKRESLKYEERIPETTLKLALGRIRAHDLKGEAKLDEVAKGVGLASYDQVLQLAQRIDTQLGDKDATVRQAARYSPGFEILIEFINLLYTMGKRGENIDVLGAERLAIAPGLTMRLKAATLSDEQEIKLVLDHASQVDSSGGAFDPSYLVGLGPQATELIMQRLQDMHRNPKKYNLGSPENVGASYVFRAAAMTGDQRMVPLLDQIGNDFKADYDRWSRQPGQPDWTPAVKVYGYVQQSRQALEQKSLFPVLPAY